MKFLTTAMCRSLSCRWLSCRSLYYPRHSRLRFQFCFLLVLLSFAIGVSSKGDEPLSVAECIKAIQTFEKLCEGKTYFLESQYGGPRHQAAGRRWAISTTRNHQYTSTQFEDFVETITARDGRTTYPQHFAGSETVVAGGKVLEVYENDSLKDIFDLDKKTEFTNERSFSTHGRIDRAGYPINTTHPFETVWNGVSFYDGELFSKLILSPASTSSVRWIADQEGFTGTEFTASVPQRGTYLFWIDTSPHGRVVRIEITKRTGDFTSNVMSPEMEVPVGSPPNFEFVWRTDTYSEEERQNMVDRYEQKAREKGVASKIHSIYWPIKYEEGVSEPSLPISISTEIKFSSDKSLHRHILSLMHRIGEVRKFDFRGTNKLVFQRYKLPDRFPVRVVDRPGLDYEYRNGDIVRVIDKSTIVQHGENELPVRKQRWSATTWMGLVFAIIFVISLFAIIIRQRRA